jgi:hypothetical protein
MMNPFFTSLACMMMLCPVNVRAEVEDAGVAKKVSDPWTITVFRLNPEGEVLNVTKTPIYQMVNGGFCGNLSLGVGAVTTSPWLIRFDGVTETKVLMFSVTFPAFKTGHVSPYGFESMQEWQGAGRYVVCETDRDKVVAEIGPASMAGKYEDDFKSASQIELVRKDGDGVVTGRVVAGFRKGEKDLAELSMPVGVGNRGWEMASGFLHFDFWQDEDGDKPILRVRIREQSKLDRLFRHDVWMPFPDEKGALVYEKDGEIVEVFIRCSEAAND